MAAAFEAKICEPGGLASRIAALARPLVFTNGVFDILHRGHATYLAQARALCSSLIVALNSRSSVRRLGKGADRPINPLADRMAPAMQGALLFQGGEAAVSAAFCASRLVDRRWGRAFGTLPAGIDAAPLLARALPA